MFRPTLFGKYLLTHRLAVGGMAEIFKAKVFGVGGFEKDLVVKQILPQYAKFREFVDMFIDEAKITVSLNHGNIVPVYELGRIDGYYFIAMEYVHGRDLSQMLLRASEQGVAFSAEQSVAVIIDTLKGLDYAHRRKDRKGNPMGIVHRDVSPQNVMVSFDGEVKILDFGIAKAARRLSETHPGAVRGKFGYLSPEVAAGEPLDRRADIFSAGTVLWELLTMQRLFGTGTEAEALDKIRRAEVEPPSKINPLVPSALDPIVLKALAKKPEDRYKDAAAFQMALSKYLYSSGNAVTSESIGEYMKVVFAEELEDEEEAAQDPERLAEIERLENQLAEKLKAQTADSGRRKRRSPKAFRPQKTEPGLGAGAGAGPQRTPTRPRASGPVSGPLSGVHRQKVPSVPPPVPTGPVDSGSLPKAVAVSGNVDQESKTLPVSEPITTESVSGRHAVSDALSQAADPNYDLDALLDEMGPAAAAPPAPAGAPDTDADPAVFEYEVFASRDPGEESDIFEPSHRGPPIGWVLAILVVLGFAGYLVVTQTDAFRSKPAATQKKAKPHYSGQVSLKVQPPFKTLPDGTRKRALLYWHQGDTPVTMTDLPLGQDHLLLIEQAGFHPQYVVVPDNAWKRRKKGSRAGNAYERTVRVRLRGEDDPKPKRITLEPPAVGNPSKPDKSDTGRLVLQTDPPGARVWLLVGDTFKAERIDPTKLHRFMGLVQGSKRRVLTLRPFKNADEPGDWKVPKAGGLTVFYHGVIHLK